MTTTTISGEYSLPMGATPQKDGVKFRVWAPFADKVYVTGDFNDWSRRNQLTKGENDIWEGSVKKAKADDEYKYIIVNGEREIECIDPYAKSVTHSSGNGIIVKDDFDWDDKDFVAPPLNELVIYELHVGTFSPRADETPGDLRGVVEQLPYLRDLGINAIQIMPPTEFPGGRSWGYNPAHIFAIESDYGGPTAFKSLVNAAHQHGVAIIFDVVYNHFGPGDLDLWRFDGWSEDNRGGIYFYNDWRAETPWGDTRPDYGREEVRQYIHDNAMMWLQEFHVDGLRFDATAYIRNAHGRDHDPGSDLEEGWNLLRWINDSAHELEPRRFTIAEDMKGNEWITRETGAGGAGFDAQWASDFVHTMRQALIPPEDIGRDLNSVAGAIYTDSDKDVFRRVIYTESHDEVANGQARLPEEIWPGQADNWFSKKRSMLGAALVFTSPGIPMIFQGQEFLEDKWFRDSDPLDWSRKEHLEGIVQYYRDLIRIRRNGDGNTRGLTGQFVDIFHVNNEDKVLAFHRWADGGPGDSVVVIANFADQYHEKYVLGLPSSGEWEVRLNSDATVYDAEFSDAGRNVIHAGQDRMASCTIPPYAVLILSQDSA